MNTLTKFRIVLGGFMLGLLLSGLTAFPLTWELGLLHKWLSPHRAQFPALFEWISLVKTGLDSNAARFPFIAYGTDWLAFGHMMICAAYVGPFREPIRNRFILEWGMFCCAAIIPVAFICGPIRHIPLAWTILDCMFGVVGIVPLFLCWKWSKQMDKAAS